MTIFTDRYFIKALLHNFEINKILSTSLHIKMSKMKITASLEIKYIVHTHN